MSKTMKEDHRSDRLKQEILDIYYSLMKKTCTHKYNIQQKPKCERAREKIIAQVGARIQVRSIVGVRGTPCGSRPLPRGHTSRSQPPTRTAKAKAKAQHAALDAAINQSSKASKKEQGGGRGRRQGGAAQRIQRASQRAAAHSLYIFHFCFFCFFCFGVFGALGAS